MIKSALISVADKKGLSSLCKILSKYDVKIFSTGNTYKKIRDLNFKVHKIDSLTNYKEILDGRVKTLHPKIHGGILFKRNKKNQINEIKKEKILPIDLVIVNLYPFKKIISKHKSYEECLENIDIGGHTLIRAAAKNFKDVTILCNIDDYKIFIKELKTYNGKTSLNFRKQMAKKAFSNILNIDNEINNWFNKDIRKKSKLIKTKLRYGENPHQKAFVYHKNKNEVFSNFKTIQGQNFSYNNVIDINSCLGCINEFSEPSVVIVKHGNPCCAASSTNIKSAFNKAIHSDKVSAYGGIIALNRKIDDKISLEIKKLFFQIIIAPGYTLKALKILKQKNILIIKSKRNKGLYLNESKTLPGGEILQQETNNIILNNKILKCVTNLTASKEIRSDLIFAIKVCKHVKSNAIVIAKNKQVLGIGPGQTNRLESIKIAINNMKKNFKRKPSFVLASDGFLPFLDNIKILKGKKCISIAQPGGSIMDQKIIYQANLQKIPMYFTNLRYFKH